MKRTLLAVLLLISFPVAYAQQYGWVRVAQVGNANTTLQAVEFVDSLFGWVAAASGTTFRTSDGGTSWMPCVVNVPLVATSISMMNRQTGWYVGNQGTRGRILRTNDGGANWFEQFFLNDRNYRGTAAQTIFRNTTAGSTRNFSPDTGNVVQTADGGVMWTDRTILDSLMDLRIMQFIDSLHGWIVGGSPLNGVYAVLRTVDGGTNWQVIRTVVGYQAVSFTDSVNGWSVKRDSPTYCFKTSDGGITWTQLGRIEDPMWGDLTPIGFTFVDSLNGWTFGSMFYWGDVVGMIYRTTNGGVSWYREHLGGSRGFGGMMLDRTHGWAIGTAGSVPGASIAILSDRNGSPGYNSIRHNSEVSGQNVGEVSVGGGYAYVGYTDGEFTLWGCNTIDRGGSASDYLIGNFTDNLVYAHQTYWGEKDPSDEDFLGPVDYAYWLSAPCLPSGPSVASGKSIGAAGAGMTSGFGDTVHLIQVAHRFAAQMRQYPDSAFQYLPLLLRLVGPSGVISEAHVGGWENFLRSLRTLSWRSSLHEVCNGLILQRKLHSRFYDDAITFADSILRGNPSERLWLVCQATKMSAYLALLDTVEAGQVLYTARSKGNRIDSSLIAFYAELLQRETAARPNREAISSGALKASQAPPLQLTPASFVLEQNYPNPFNPSTRISFALPQDAHVTLKLYDILGREVMTLLNESRSAGYHHAMLDGSKLASGVYLYRMDAGQYSSTKRLLLLK